MEQQLIYVVEDDENIREIIAYTLENAGFSVQVFKETTSFFTVLKEKIPDLILLDIMLSTEESGLDVIKKLKKDEKTSEIPVIFITAKSSEIDKAHGLDIGADDYITKPFGVLELTARVKAVLRRFSKKEGTVIYKDLKIDKNSKIIIKEGKEISLTYKEYELFVYLYENIGIVISRNTLLDSLWGVDYYGGSRTVDVHIRSLRLKLEDNADEPIYIKTMRGHGYKLLKEE